MLKLFNRKKKDNKGFTLVELVVVVAILALLVGLLAPQYTKYVEKSRKSADVSNMDEMVKAVQVYAAVPDGDLPAATYTITIGSDTTKSTVKITKKVNGKDTPIDVVKETIPDYESTKLKSSRWNDDSKGVVATIVVDDKGGTTVTYSPDDFATAIAKNKTAA